MSFLGSQNLTSDGSFTSFAVLQDGWVSIDFIIILLKLLVI
jgi:hypothetical protein